MTDNYKAFKKIRLGQERMIRANIQALEAAFQIGSNDKVRHALADLLSSAHNLEVVARMCLDEKEKHNE